MFRPTHELEKVTRFLRSWREDVRDVEPLGGGAWSQVFGFRSGGREYVLRLGTFLEDYEKDRLAVRFAGPDLPVPEIVETGEALGGSFSISARIYGEALDALPRVEFEAALPSVLRMLDAIRLANVSETHGYGVWRTDGDAPAASWREYLLDVRNGPAESRIEGWEERLQSQRWAMEMFEAGYRALEGMVESCPEERYLVHADTVGDNVRVRDGEVSGVVDWGNAIYGDFLYDLARLIFYQPWYPEMEGIDIAGAARAHHASIGLEVSAFDERLRACAVHIALDAQEYNAFMERWDGVARVGRRMRELADADGGWG